MEQLLTILAQAYGQGAYSVDRYNVGGGGLPNLLPNTGNEIAITLVSLAAIASGIWLFGRLRKAQ